MDQKATPIGRGELDRDCAAHTPIVTGYSRIGPTMLACTWYLAKRDGKYLKVSADNLEEDKHPGESEELHNGDTFELNGKLRKIQV